VDVRLIAPLRGVRLDIPNGDRVRFTTPGPPPVTVTLGQQTQKEAKAYGDAKRCEARVRLATSRKIAEAFQALHEGHLPPGSLDPPEGQEFRLGNMAVFDLVPQPVKDFVRGTQQQLQGAAESVVDVVRWRNANEGPHNPLSPGRAEWKIAGRAWRRMPWGVYTSVASRSIPPFDERRVDEIQALIDASIIAPLSHTLFREAWEQRHSNPRSALLIGMTALEIGIKQHLSDRLPDTRWLLEELPAPPITRILGEYLAPLEGASFNAARLKLLKKGVTLRNKVAHVGATPVRPKDLQEILLAVRETLWWLDGLKGYEWAKNRRDLVTYN